MEDETSRAMMNDIIPTIVPLAGDEDLTML
jgi:hypothetical protein